MSKVLLCRNMIDYIVDKYIYSLSIVQCNSSDFPLALRVLDRVCAKNVHHTCH